MLQAGNPGKSRDVCDHPALFLTNNHAILKCLLASYTSVIYINVDFPDSAAQILNIDLERIANWAAKWLVNFNANKNESMLISRKILRANHPILYFNNVPIVQVQSHKHLGIYLSDKCEWHVHLENTEKKSWSRVHLLRSLKFDLDRKSLQTIIFLL